MCGAATGYNREGGTGLLRLSGGPHQPLPAVWTRTRTATHRSWPSLSVCAGAASVPGPAARQRRSTLCRCTRACWCCAASPAPWTHPGCPRPGPLPSTWSPSECPSAAPASCPGWYGDHRPQRSPRCGQGSPPRLDSGELSAERAPPIYVYLLAIYMPWVALLLLPRVPGRVPGLQASSLREEQ